MIRESSLKGQLLRMGFVDVDLAGERLLGLGAAADPVVWMLGRAADPDLALGSLVDLIQACEDPTELIQTLTDDEGTTMRLLAVLGASEALGAHLCRHPEQWRELADPLLGSVRPTRAHLRNCLMEAVGADPTDPGATATVPEAALALRIEYRRHLLRLAARDLAHETPMQDVASELADLATGVLDAALAIARAQVPDSDRVRLAVIAMGKCGGRELNYVSDVDVIFVHAPVHQDDAEIALRVATQLAAGMMRVCAEHTGEGSIWEVDAALRPEGKAGALSRTLAGHEGYYGRWASTWEFQALLKARPAAGDLDLGQEYVEMTAPLVWSASARDGFVADTQAMRRRVESHIPADRADRELKLGAGGLRDVEFAVQLLQLVHGRTDESLRASTTLRALRDLADGGYVGLEDAEALLEAYSFLRSLEHRMQLRQLRRTHLVPDDEVSLRRLGRAMGYFREPATTLTRQWQRHKREVRRLHQKLFYRPLLSAVARLGDDEAVLSSRAALDRLQALGFIDPAAALRHLAALTAGVSRTAAIQRTLLPVMLQWFAEGPDPDAGLFGFRRISESLGSTPWYLRTLRDEGLVAERLARILSTSRYVTSLLEREPDGVRLLSGDLVPREAESISQEMLSVVERRTSLDSAVKGIRAVRRRELFRIAAADVAGPIDVEEVGRGLSRITDATLEATLAALIRARSDDPPARIAMVAMGRYGGFELSYSSDADVLFVQDPVDGADPSDAAAFATAVAQDLRSVLGVAGPDPALVIDADLRPDGRKGPLVRSLGAYGHYYRSDAAIWERQALLRADAVVGDLTVREKFTVMADAVRYPLDGLSEDEVREIRRIKGRVDTERLPKGASPATHLKLGRGGLADVEWTIQLLQLRHAGAVASLRTPRTMAAL
ncbi:MAG: bifunctional [glutamine synthetase] adenylyltransferase/[glutamine synthetase]-adenylyl-L-tyrosine phosphorylase, partial [Nocardioides sp.]